MEISDLTVTPSHPIDLTQSYTWGGKPLTYVYDDAEVVFFPFLSDEDKGRAVGVFDARYALYPDPGKYVGGHRGAAYKYVDDLRRNTAMFYKVTTGVDIPHAQLPARESVVSESTKPKSSILPIAAAAAALFFFS